ncbi:MAG: DedA family protein [Candidatus Moranbacteria bacterium]|nr:DedA family protein [Candidatus Moranbacteria bacterium]
MLEFLSSAIVGLIESTHYWGIFILMALESALIPIPSEVTMPFSGYLAQQGKLSFWAVVAAGALANLVGSWGAYALGYYLEESVILKLVRSYGKFVLLSEKEYLQSLRWFRKYGQSVAFFSRLLPAVRTFISLPAGLAGMNLWKFSFYTFVGSFLWSSLLTWIGFSFGANWKDIEPYFQKFHFLIVAAFVIFVLWYLNHKLHFIRKIRSHFNK